ncbi:MAG: hypothetical protein Q7K40_02975 [bacterium]|nr:hypothetical protein [bacterium]
MRRYEHDLALADFSKAIKLDSTAPIYWLNCSRAENTLGKREEAKADALKAQQLGIQVEDAYLKEVGIN